MTTPAIAIIVAIVLFTLVLSATAFLDRRRARRIESDTARLHQDPADDAPDPQHIAPH